MGKLYRCDIDKEGCIDVSESRMDFMSLTAGNDQRTKLLCCVRCLPDDVPVPSHMESER